MTEQQDSLTENPYSESNPDSVMNMTAEKKSQGQFGNMISADPKVNDGSVPHKYDGGGTDAIRL